MKNKTLKTFFLWILALTFIGAVILWGYLLFETYSLKTEINSIKSEISATAGRELYLNSVKNLLRDMDDKLKSIKDRFITEDKIPVFIEFLEDEASLHGIKADLSSIAIDPLSKNATFRILRVHINGLGSWEELISFVHSLDTMKYAARIEKINFSKSAKDSDWNVSMDISQNIK
jgi:Tfp pilus assembly protein PilO